MKGISKCLNSSSFHFFSSVLPFAPYQSQESAQEYKLDWSWVDLEGTAL